MFESFAYVRPESTGVVEWTLRGEELIASGENAGLQEPIALSRIQKATITLQDERTGDFINTRVVDGAKHLVVDPAGTLVPTGDVVIDPTSGAAKWSYQVEDTTVADPDTVDVAEYLATLALTYANIATPSTFDRKLFAQHRMRIPVRPALCVPADVFRQKQGKLSEEALPLVEFLCEAVTDRFEEHTDRLVRERSETEVLHVYDDCEYSLKLKRYPIKSITSIKEASDGDFDSATALEATEYFTPGGGQLGCVRLRNRAFAVGSVEIAYVGGIARSTGAVPPNLRNACARQVAFMWDRASQLGVSSVTAKDATVQVIATDLLADVKAVWDLYRSRVF